MYMSVMTSACEEPIIQLPTILTLPQSTISRSDSWISFTSDESWQETKNDFLEFLDYFYLSSNGAMMISVTLADPIENEKCKKINSGAPKSMDFLSESSRTHFQEVLEYLEALGISYHINNHLIGNKKYCTETIFSIINANHDKNDSQPKTLAVGVRYDGLSKKIGLKKEIQGVGISILIKNKKPELRKEIKKVKKPFASFVQLGFESKLLSLQIIEELRSVKIPLYLSLARDRLGAQVSVIEKHQIPYALIMGKKEAVEKTVIVRNNETHAQEIIAIDDLPKYMKKLER